MLSFFDDTTFVLFIRKKLNASEPRININSNINIIEHPPSQEGEVPKRLGGIYIGCRDKNLYVVLNGFPNVGSIMSTVKYRGEIHPYYAVYALIISIAMQGHQNRGKSTPGTWIHSKTQLYDISSLESG